MAELVGGTALLASYGASKVYKSLYPRKKSRFNPKPVDNQAAIKRLARQVGSNRQEIIRIKKHVTETRVTANVFNNEFNLPTLLVNDTTFRDNILGDTWKNKALVMKLDCDSSLLKLRVLVMRSIKPGTSYDPPDNQAFTNIPDPNKYQVYLDNSWVPAKQDSRGQLKSFKVNLRNLVSQYDTANTTLERGDIRLYVISEGSGTYEMSYQHSVQNK